LINLKDWNDRKQSVVEIMAELEENLKVYQVQILNFQPPAVPGYGAAGGFELRLLDKTGSGDYMEAINNDFVKELNKRRVIECV
jgi:HAE1 family hydrophobic/amphiphilic exporter-1